MADQTYQPAVEVRVNGVLEQNVPTDVQPHERGRSWQLERGQRLDGPRLSNPRHPAVEGQVGRNRPRDHFFVRIDHES